jgi:hypothetical protein
MSVPDKYRRLVEATQRFNSFHRFIDLITVLLFLATAIAVANKLLPGKLIDLEYLQWSWRVIGAATGLFLFLFVVQAYHEGRGQYLSAFKKEAALKAARKNNFRRPYR